MFNQSIFSNLGEKVAIILINEEAGSLHRSSWSYGMEHYQVFFHFGPDILAKRMYDQHSAYCSSTPGERVALPPVA